METSHSIYMTWKRFMQAAINPLWLTCDVGVGNEDFVVRRGSLSPNTELSAKKPPDFFCSSPLSRCAKRIASTSSFAAFILKPPLCSLTLGTRVDPMSILRSMLALMTTWSKTKLLRHRQPLSLILYHWRIKRKRSKSEMITTKRSITASCEQGVHL